MKLPIDFDLLRRQKLTLLVLSSSDRTTVGEQEHLMGLVHLIDYIQDEAVRDGVPESEVFPDFVEVT